MTVETIRQAERFGILSRLQQLESDLLQIEGVEEITFDVAKVDYAAKRFIEQTK